MSPSPSAAAQQTVPHVHFDDQCPVCDQEIPSERLEEVHGRYAVRLREQTSEATAQLRDQHSKDRALAVAKAKADLEQARAEAAAALERQKQENAARELAIREEEARKAGALLTESLAQAEAQRKERESALLAKAAEAERLAQEAREAQGALKAEIEHVKQSGAEALAQEKQAWSAREEAIKGEAKRATDAEKAKLAEDLNAKIADALTAKQAAEAQAEALKQNQEALIAGRVLEAREALEKAKSDALLEKDKAHFDERQKWQQKLDELQRKVDNQKSNELGEGAEIKLYEALKEAFPDDRIRRVEKGALGADIVHEIVEDGRICGKIVYDSKNRNIWQDKFATKLRSDQIAERADHAILSTNKFPKQTRELHIQENVIISCPARVLVLTELLRGHIIQTHSLRLSNEARDAKTEKLYTFITSSHCRQMIEAIEDLVEKLEKIETDELKTHQAVWTKRGALLKAVLKTNGDFRFQLASILGGDGMTA